MKRIILTPNPYRDKNFQTVRKAVEILKNAGVDPRVCLPFEVDRSFDLPRDIRFSRLDREMPNAAAVICFGGDGTILHAAKDASNFGVPIVGVNMGSVGFMAELEQSEILQLTRLISGEYKLENRMLLDVRVIRDGRTLFRSTALNDALCTMSPSAQYVP